MNGQTISYEQSLREMEGPYLLSQLPKQRMDLPGLMRYAKSKGVKVDELSVKEKNRFIYK